MKSPAIIVIVPVYNQEHLLKRCVNSILNQDYTDFELILINDGSTDSSSQICDKYASKDSRIRVIHQPNSGVSLARQKGLDCASGEWILFIDSDDYVEPCAFTKISSYLNKSDIIIFNFYVLNNQGRTERKQKLCGNLIDSMYSGNVFGALFNKVIRKAIIDQTQVTFRYNLSFCEDMCFLSELCTKYAFPLQIVHLNIPLYTYDTNTVSLTRPTKFTQKQIDEYRKYITIISRILSTHPQLEQFTLPNKIEVKLGLLQINCSYKVYKQNYPETYILIQKHNAIACRFISPKRQKLLKWAQERPGFYIAKLILKILLLKSTLKKLYSNK